MHTCVFARREHVPLGKMGSQGACGTVAAPPPGIEEGDFELIEAAVRETERGRWFLEEFARRVRSAEMADLVRSIDRLDGRAASRQAEDNQTRDHIRRVVDLLAPLVEYLDTHDDAPFPQAEDAVEPGSETEAGLRMLAALDGLSVTDKLKLFR